MYSRCSTPKHFPLLSRARRRTIKESETANDEKENELEVARTSIFVNGLKRTPPILILRWKADGCCMMVIETILAAIIWMDTYIRTSVLLNDINSQILRILMLTDRVLTFLQLSLSLSQPQKKKRKQIVDAVVIITRTQWKSPSNFFSITFAHTEQRLYTARRFFFLRGGHFCMIKIKRAYHLWI